MDIRKESGRMAKQVSKKREKRLSKLKARIIAGRYRVDNFELAKALVLSA